MDIHEAKCPRMPQPAKCKEDMQNEEVSANILTISGCMGISPTSLHLFDKLHMACASAFACTANYSLEL